jgi:hypothetical protein
MQSSENVTDPLTGLEGVVEALRKYDSVERVELGRRASMPQHVSQDLELWISKQQVEDHWLVAARAGSQVQELSVYGSLDKDELKRAIDSSLNQAKASEVA